MTLSPLLLIAVITGCVKDAVFPSQGALARTAPPSRAGVPALSLAGTWEYEEGGNTIQILLNEYGNGIYRWKEGKFVTTSYSNGRWKGSWSQIENDREGGFEVLLSEEGLEGEGRWWYTRIGGNTAPTQPGGFFHLARRSESEQSIQQRPDQRQPGASVLFNVHGQSGLQEEQ